ncbi:maltooligosyl trehalose hydrolase [Murinocardiopsis flavida]|uniref:Malto-oligosyltrehalose trehalohydrolase n=1 Tax=Murinocardiopsis flavida TaxID=645275 RepID=A0A2P8DL85_9ACTN|nr:malto-oligosyltrehalose trehalohydrolase [Murinocardiopsis flavida]PSK97987.1 maltooligosyl trehalose hydrolase [Murinocardiopsis flavida]
MTATFGPPPLGEPGLHVWAPLPRRVRAWIDGDVSPMSRDDAGWWHLDSGPAPGADYGFLLDDDPTPLPDPRSAHQPSGVHAPSRRYDHTAYRWGDTVWTGRQCAGSVIYELHIGTFTAEGTFDAAADRLDHLVGLGVDLVEVMPVNAFDGRHGWGYDGVLWGAVHEPYGGPDGFKRFVDACHARGLGVLLDVVYNHLGPSGAYLPRFGPYFGGENAWGPSLNLDGEDSDEVRAFVIGNALGMLRDFHLDGLRLDAVHALHDERATPVLAGLADEVAVLSAALRRPLSLIAESDRNDPRTVTAREAGGLGMTAQWCDDLHHALHAALTGEDGGYYADFAGPGVLAHTLEHAFLHAGTYSSFRRRTHGAPVERRRIPGSRFVASLQNHDQIGNRATGDRMAAATDPGLLACGAALLLCSPYTPMLFMGEEWAAGTPWRFFASFPDPGLADAVRRGRRREFAAHGWGAADIPDPMDPATRDASVLDWSEPGRAPHAAMLATYRDLIALRRTHAELSDPRLDRFVVDAAPDGRVLTLHRGGLRVVCNLRPEDAVAALDRPATAVLLARGAAEPVDGGVRLAARSFAVVRT